MDRHFQLRKVTVYISFLMALTFITCATVMLLKFPRKTSCVPQVNPTLFVYPDLSPFIIINYCFLVVVGWCVPLVAVFYFRIEKAKRFYYIFLNISFGLSMTLAVQLLTVNRSLFHDTERLKQEGVVCQVIYDTFYQLVNIFSWMFIFIVVATTLYLQLYIIPRAEDPFNETFIPHILVNAHALEEGDDDEGDDDEVVISTPPEDIANQGSV